MTAMTAKLERTNENNQSTWSFPADAFGEVIPAEYVVVSKTRAYVKSGARASRIVASCPAAKRVDLLVGAVVFANSQGNATNAGKGRIDTFHVAGARGVTGEAAAKVWRALKATAPRDARARGFVKATEAEEETVEAPAVA